MQTASKGKHKPVVWLLAKLVVSVGLLAYLWHHTQFRFRDWPEVHILWLLPTMLILIAQPVIGALRWRVILRGFGASLSVKEVLRIHLIGCFFNVFLPASVGGDVVRVWYAGRKNIDTGVAVRSVLADRLMALVAIIVMIALSLPFAGPIIHDPTVLAVLQWAIGLSLLGLVMALMLNQWLQRWREKTWAKFLLWPLQILHTVVWRYKIAWPSLIISLVVHAVTCIATWLIAQSYGVPLTWLQIAVLVPPVILALGLPISVGGWGAREMAMVAALSSAGVNEQTAFAIALTLGLLSTLANMPGLVLWLMQGAARPQP